MKDDNDSIFDYVEEHQFTHAETFKSFDAAVTFAKTKIDEDVCGQVRIARQIKVRSRFRGDDWRDDAVWHVSDELDNPSEDAPEYVPEFELLDDEDIVR